MIRQVDTIVIHSSAAPNGKPVTVKDIDARHERNGSHRTGFFRINKSFNTGLTSIGYHFVINTSGSIQTGRHLDEIGAHAAGHNSRSIGICLAGTDQFTPEQWVSLIQLIMQLRATITNSSNPVKHINIVGHNSYADSHTTCPNFDVPAWLANGRPEPHNIFSGGDHAA